MNAELADTGGVMLKLAIFHNILWSKYKGSVFSELHKITDGTNTKVSFTQIAETDTNRVGLNGVDLAYHRYPYELIFEGAYGQVPRFRRCLALMRRAWEIDADVVVMPGYEQLEYWAMLAVLVLRGKCRAVFCDSTAKDQPRNRLKSIAKRFFFLNCDGFFCYGQRSKEYLQSLGVPLRKIFHRCQAAALPQGYSAQAAQDFRSKNARLREEHPMLVYVGRLSHEKGLDTLIDAFERMAREYPSVQMHLIGAGPMRDWLEMRVSEPGLKSRVVLLGSMPAEKLADQYGRATALVLPSTSEPWGLVVNEALSYGCPVIVSDRCGCVPELVTRATGLEFETGNVAALEAAMRQLLDHASDYSTRGCIEHIQQYSPALAAEQIRFGANVIWKSNWE